MKQPDIEITRVLAITALLVCFQNSEAATGISKYIIGGRQAASGQFPWQVQITGPLSPGWVTVCGGTIISSRWILTSGHCYKGWLPIVVYCGALLNGGKDAKITVRKFDSYFAHEGYTGNDGLYLPNDLALIKLSAPLTWSARVKPVKLPRRSQQHLPEGAKIVASGFGRIEEYLVDRMSKFLRYMEFELRNDEECQQHFVLCSKIYPDRSGNNGDSGGPWVWMDPQGVNRLVGVYSTSDSNSTGYNSNAVTVASYLDWISYHTGIQIED